MKNLLTLLVIVMIGRPLIAQNVGIGTISPSNTLHIVPPSGTDPLRIDGLKIFSTETLFLVIDTTTGIVKHMPIDSLITLFGDSVDTDLDSVKYSNDSLYLYEDDKILTTYISSTQDTALIDSLILAKYDTLHNIISDSLLNDTAWLNAIADSINTDNQNIDSLTLMGTNLTTYIQNGSSASINLQPIVDSAIVNSSDNQNLETPTLTGTVLNTNIENGAPTSINLQPIIDSAIANSSDLTAWKITGNNGTTASTNFLGTTDNTALSIKVNNIEKVRVETNGTISTRNTGQSIFIGENAGALDDLSLNRNVFVGYRSGFSNTTGYYNVGIGYRALSANTTGYYNVGIGYRALSANTTGRENTVNGYSALFSNISGHGNVANGSFSLNLNASGINNTANGWAALRNNTTGSYNVANGIMSLHANTTGNFNVANGPNSLSSNTTGDFNVANGLQSLRGNNSGSNNTANGHQSLSSNTIGNTNTANGYRAFFGGSAYSNSTALGANSTINASNKIRFGDATITVIEGQVAYSFPSDGRFKTNIKKEGVKGLDFILKLNPVTYNFDTKKFDQFLLQDIDDSTKNSIIESKNYEESQQIKHSGFIAQEVEEAMKKTGYDFDGVNIPKSDKENYSVSYSQFVVPLVKAVQQQQEIINNQAREIKKMKADNEENIVSLKEEINKKEERLINLEKQLNQIQVLLDQ